MDERANQVLAEYANLRADEARDEFQEDAAGWISEDSSPIENLMALGIIYAIQSTSWFGYWGRQNRFFPSDKSGDAFTAPFVEPQISIWQQVTIDKYRADFVARFVHWEGGYVFGAIECDGHDHHDLTKEQAIHDRERDRHFQARGLIILRYTGKEIYRNPLKCAADALGILERRAAGKSSPRWQVG